jgi:hypothetical protein
MKIFVQFAQMQNSARYAHQRAEQIENRSIELECR